jgi:hypothetical protein
MENVFVVRADAKRYVFSADSQDDKTSWIRSIELVIKKVNTKSQILSNQPSETKPVTQPVSTQDTEKYTAEKLKVDKMVEQMTNLENAIGALIFQTANIQSLTGSKKFQPEKKQPNSDDSDDSLTSDDSDEEEQEPKKKIHVEKSMRNFTISNVKQHNRDDVKDPVQRLSLIGDDVDNVVVDLKGVVAHLENPKTYSQDSTRLLEQNRELLAQIEAFKERELENEKKMTELNHHKTLLIKVRTNTCFITVL